MKNVVIQLVLFVCLVAICSCGSKSSMTNSDSKAAVVQNDTIRIANDSLEYEVLIIEPGFNAWLVSQVARGFRSQNVMDISNDIKIPIYNQRVDQPFNFDPQLYPMRIDYNPTIDYGYEVTYLLFNYFVFFEQQYNQRL